VLVLLVYSFILYRTMMMMMINGRILA